MNQLFFITMVSSLIVAFGLTVSLVILFYREQLLAKFTNWPRLGKYVKFMMYREYVTIFIGFFYFFCFFITYLRLSYFLCTHPLPILTS
jgi:hypothetical protein